MQKYELYQTEESQHENAAICGKQGTGRFHTAQSSEVGRQRPTIPYAGGKSLLHLPTRYPAGTNDGRRGLKLRP